MSINTKMTAIADAIRAKTGGTEALTLDGMAEAIAGLELGGGLPDTIEAVAGGTHTLTSNVGGYGSFTIEHGLGVRPDAVLFYISEGLSSSIKSYCYMCLIARTDVYVPDVGRGDEMVTTGYVNANGYILASAQSRSSSHSALSTSTSFTISDPNNTGYKAASYKWIAVKFAS